MGKLLNTTASNTKIRKSQLSKLAIAIDEKVQIRIASLSLMPNIRLCPSQDIAACKDPCLFTSGRGVFPSVAKSRASKTEWFESDRDGFLSQLKKEMHNFIRTCKKQQVKPVFRLNTISDVQWENLLDLEGEFGEAFFYDYTKLGKRLHKPMPSNYHLIFSYSKRDSYKRQVKLALCTDVPIAVVGRGPMPDFFLGRPCIDGDKSDIFNVQSGRTVVWLKAKGRAIGTDGDDFVVDMTQRIPTVVVSEVRDMEQGATA